jgi:hypothetical protein
VYAAGCISWTGQYSAADTERGPVARDIHHADAHADPDPDRYGKSDRHPYAGTHPTP